MNTCQNEISISLFNQQCFSYKALAFSYIFMPVLGDGFKKKPKNIAYYKDNER
jgi:hypothetical protein